MHTTKLAWLVFPLGAAIVSLAVLSGGASKADAPSDTVAFLAELGIPVTAGAAAGYVPDETCGACHSDKAQTFQHVGMSQSFYRPSADRVIEDFDDNHFYHAPSARHYEMQRRGDEYWFRRYKLAADGSRYDVFEKKVDWILGSGHHARVYLYQEPDGSLYQLPLAWYSQEHKWEMAPGFERKDQAGVMRAVRQECMFCHNAFPEVAKGSDVAGMPDVFPAELPQGIGCQRCHGPGAEHVRRAAAGTFEVEEIRAAIVNPAKLPRETLYSICYGCHMQPVVAMLGVRRFGRPAFSFRPGEDLSSFRVEMDVKEPNRARSDRFEINHHPYRLEQSACFLASGGALGCLTCHDPHVKITPANRAAHYRAACLSCHETDAAGLPKMRTVGATHPAIADDADCTLCHMPERRTQDVIHVTMTDHRIVRDPGHAADLLAPIDKKDTEVDEVFIPEPSGLSHDEATMYKAIAVLRYTNGSADYAADALAGYLQKLKPPEFEPWLELAGSRIVSHDFDAALRALDEAESRAPGNPKVREQRAVATYAKGDTDGGIALMQALLADRPDLPEARYKLAVMYREKGDLDEVLRQARLALADRDNLWIAWRLIGQIERQRGNMAEAEGAFSKALAIEPGDPESREGIVAALTALGRTGDAARYADSPPQ